ncbi:MAG: sugar ABC transporter substrate-binding protein [Anaerolineales bacterium]|nr:sugar ABC transporter substrate-binding protein [Anaerolineales bacterium]
MKRTLLWKVLSSLMVASLLLAACAPAATPAPTQAPQPTTPQQPTTAPQPTVAPTTPPTTEITLRWRTRPDNKEEADVYAGISDEVAAKLGFKLVYEPGGTETAGYQDQLITEVQGGTAPDVFWIPGTDIARFAKGGYILNLAGVAKDFDPSAFYPGPMFHLTFNPENGKSGKDSGALWGLPRDVSTFVLYLNLDLLNEAGAQDPRELAKAGRWNWDTFAEVTAKVAQLGGGKYGYGASNWWGPYGVWVNAAGGSFFTADLSGCAMNTPEAKTGLEFMRKIYSEPGWAVPYGDDAEAAFRAGNVAMFQNGRWATPGVRTVTFKYDAVELPNGPAGTPGNWLFWGAYVVNAKTKYPEEAWKLVQALTEADIQLKIAERGTNIPSRVSKEALDAFLTFTPPDNAQAFLNGIADAAKPTAEGPLWNGNWPLVDQVYGAGVTAVVTGKRTVDDFIAKICDEAAPGFKP